MCDFKMKTFKQTHGRSWTYINCKICNISNNMPLGKVDFKLLMMYYYPCSAYIFQKLLFRCSRNEYYLRVWYKKYVGNVAKSYPHISFSSRIFKLFSQFDLPIFETFQKSVNVISRLKITFPKSIILLDTLQIFQVRKYNFFHTDLSGSLTVQKYPFMTTLLPFNCTCCLSLAIKVNCFRYKAFIQYFLKSVTGGNRLSEAKNQKI